MKITLISFITIMFIVGCATTHTAAPVLFQEYSQYNESTNKDNIKEVADIYFSQSLLGENYKTNPDASAQLLFKNYMVDIVNHYEKVNSENGCLIINGYDKEKYPLIFSLKYILNDGNWLINEIHVVFIESENDFSKKAKCPESYIN